MLAKKKPGRRGPSGQLAWPRFMQENAIEHLHKHDYYNNSNDHNNNNSDYYRSISGQLLQRAEQSLSGQRFAAVHYCAK
jgi:hypothetical protein